MNFRRYTFFALTRQRVYLENVQNFNLWQVFYLTMSWDKASGLEDDVLLHRAWISAKTFSPKESMQCLQENKNQPKYSCQKRIVYGWALAHLRGVCNTFLTFKEAIMVLSALLKGTLMSWQGFKPTFCCRQTSELRSGDPDRLARTHHL